MSRGLALIGASHGQPLRDVADVGALSQLDRFCQLQLRMRDAAEDARRPARPR